jgi:hypothetical protein
MLCMLHTVMLRIQFYNKGIAHSSTHYKTSRPRPHGTLQVYNTIILWRSVYIHDVYRLNDHTDTGAHPHNEEHRIHWRHHTVHIWHTMAATEIPIGQLGMPSVRDRIPHLPAP